MTSPSNAFTPVSSSQLVARALLQAQKLSQRRKSLTGRLSVLSDRIRKHQTVRLSVAGVFIVALLVAAAFPSTGVGFPAFVVFLPLFTWLVMRTRNLQNHESRMKKLEQFYARQEARCLGRVPGRRFEHAASLASANPDNSGLVRDFALFGPQSVWTLIDETLTDQGESELIGWFFSAPQTSAAVRSRQTLVQSLRTEAWFYTKLSLLADEDDARLSTHSIESALKNPFVMSGFNLAFGIVLFTWLAALVLSIADVNYGPLMGETRLWPIGFAVFAFVNLSLLYRAGSGFKAGIGLTHHLNQVEPIFGSMEKRTVASPNLRSLCPTIAESGPAKNAKQLNFVLGFLGVETNPLLHLLINAFTPWTMTGAFFLERARMKLASTFPTCLRELAHFEALGSLVVFDRYQTNVYPTLESQKIDLKRAFHPLIDRLRVVDNDFFFPSEKSLGLLTGSNMSGKSTFLRTIAVNQLLANMGAPVFAEKFATRPLRIESCIEVSDSLRDGFSYFYAEVRRIKALLDQAHIHDDVLFLIDEIFRGTNNRERQTGSRAVIRTLAASSRAQGFISTHDLELVSLEDTEPSVMNLHFREDVVGSEMIFPYKLNRGPCPTTNALKIMANEGIRIELGQ